MIDFSRPVFENFSSLKVKFDKAKEGINDLGKKALSPEQVEKFKSAETQMENAEDGYEKQNSKIKEFRSFMFAITVLAENPPVSSLSSFFRSPKPETSLPQELKNIELKPGTSVSYTEGCMTGNFTFTNN